MSWRSMSICSMPWSEKISTMGIACCCVSSSTMPSSSSPARSWARSFSRVASREASGATCSSEPLLKGSPPRRGSSRSSSRSSASRSAFSCTSAMQLGLDHGDAELGEVADHGLDVAADVADLGVLGRLDLDERRLASLASRRAISVLPTPVGPIMMMFFGATSSRSSARQLLPPPAVAQRDGDRALGVVLADDVAVELGDDLRRREAGRSRAASQLLHRDLVVGVDADAGGDPHGLGHDASASSSAWATSARAAASAYGPPGADADQRRRRAR